MSGVLAAPDEILIQILLELGLHDILALRKTCIRLSRLTRDRQPWLRLLQHQSLAVPLPCHLYYPSSWQPLSSDDVQTIVRRLHIVNRTWLLPRTQYFVSVHQESCATHPAFNNGDGSRTIYSIDVFLDRWLLCVYHEKVVELWDLDSALRNPQKPVLCASHQIGGPGSFSSAITHLDEQDNILTIAVSCHELCHVMQVQLHPSSAISPQICNSTEPVHIRSIAVIPFASPIFCLRAIYPNQSLLLLGIPSSFHLLNWKTRQRTIVTVRSEDEEELRKGATTPNDVVAQTPHDILAATLHQLRQGRHFSANEFDRLGVDHVQHCLILLFQWNGVIGATFLTQRHILVLKAHSLEICTLLEEGAQTDANVINLAPEDNPNSHARPPMSATVHSHYFPGTTFRGVSFSRPVSYIERVTKGNAETETLRVSLSFLAYDVLRGLFHCCVSIVIPSSPDPNMPYRASPPLDVQVSLLAAHNMAVPITTGTQDTPTPRSGFSLGSRGFVSACVLGPTGRRGVWVERRRGTVRRVVYGFSIAPEDGPQGFGEEGNAGPRAPYKVNKDEEIDPDAATDPEEMVEPNATHSHWNTQSVPAIDGKEVYDVNSFDLRDDITHIAFSETTGTIALGTRKGDIRVLSRPC